MTNYEVFAGILCMVAAIIGLAGSFISSIGGLIALGVDALTALFLFAGGIVRAPRPDCPSFLPLRVFELRPVADRHVSRHSPPLYHSPAVAAS